MAEEKQDNKVGGSEMAQRGMADVALHLVEAGAVGAAATAGGTVAHHVVDKLLNRPNDPPPPEVVLPPGVPKE